MAGLDFQPDESTTFGADMNVHITQDGLAVDGFTPRGDLAYSSIDLNWLKLSLSDLSLPSLTYTSGQWDFELGMNLGMCFPDLDSPGSSRYSQRNFHAGRGLPFRKQR